MCFILQEITQQKKLGQISDEVQTKINPFFPFKKTFFLRFKFLRFRFIIMRGSSDCDKNNMILWKC